MTAGAVRRPLTTEAQAFIAPALAPGAAVIDATIGNGHDTLFLARGVVPGGEVYGFDVQRAALENTRARLAEYNLDVRLQWVLGGHQNMLERVPARLHGGVAAIMFNLGYLPAGDRQITTSAATTLEALEASRRVLSQGGRLSVLCYPGHPGGGAETRRVQAWADALPACRYRVSLVESDRPGEHTPRLFLIAATASPEPSHQTGTPPNPP